MPSAPTLCIITGMRIVAGALAIVMLAGCDGASGGVIDGWEVGDRVACGVDFDCDRYARAAIEWLDRVSPGHASIVSIEVHDQARPHPRSGGSISAVVLRLADRSMRAVGVGNSGIEPGLFIFSPPLD